MDKLDSRNAGTVRRASFNACLMEMERVPALSTPTGAARGGRASGADIARFGEARPLVPVRHIGVRAYGAAGACQHSSLCG